MEVMGKMPMSMRTPLLRQSNDLCLWDRIAMFHGWARRHQPGIDVVREPHEQPQGLLGLPQELFEQPGIVYQRWTGNQVMASQLKGSKVDVLNSPKEIKQVMLDVLLFLMVTALAI
jgi:hypothetical protein